VPALQSGRLTLGLGYNNELLKYGSPLSRMVHPSLYSQGMAGSRPPIEAPNLALLRVCKELHEEVSYLAWVVMRKRFFDSQVFIPAVQARFGPAMRFDYPRTTIELAFTNADFVKFFGVQVNWQLRLVLGNSSGPLLQSLTGVKNLQLRFRTLDDGYKTSPWGRIDHKLHLGHYGGYAYTCCQRTMVDWICTLAYPFVQGIDKVTVAGAVKKDSREKWNAIFAGNRDHDQAAEMATFLATPDTAL
jgi:hypothetical protein